MGNPRYVDGFEVRVHRDLIDRPHEWRNPRLVFVNSMSDLFHPKVPTDVILKIFATMSETPRHTYQVLTKRPKRVSLLANRLPWPANVWMGVSVEAADTKWRVDALRDVPAAVRFLSCEPLLGPLTLTLNGIGWLIVGGESGPHARPMHPDWARSLRDQCQLAKVPFFFKQWGGRTPKAGGRDLDGRTWDQMPARSLDAA
jgi:protein gp37